MGGSTLHYYTLFVQGEKLTPATKKKHSVTLVNVKHLRVVKRRVSFNTSYYLSGVCGQTRQGINLTLIYVLLFQS